MKKTKTLMPLHVIWELSLYRGDSQRLKEVLAVGIKSLTSQNIALMSAYNWGIHINKFSFG